MHPVLVDDWSRRDSVLHRRDARAKLIALLVLLASVATTRSWLALLGSFGIVLTGVLMARLPTTGLLLRAAAVLPFTAVFAFTTWIAGDPAQALLLVVRSYISSVAALLVAATTPMPQLIGGVERSGAPRLLVTVAQMVYRYLFVLAGEALAMRDAGRSRGGPRFGATGATVAVLFGRSQDRAQRIHRAMLARGYAGVMPQLHARAFGYPDAALVALLAAAIVTLRLAV